MWKKSSIVLIFCAIFLTACSAMPSRTSSVAPAAPPQISQDSVGQPGSVPAPGLPFSNNGPAKEAPAAPAAESGGGLSNQAAAERIVIKNANLTIIVADPADTMDKISSMAAEMQGFVVSSNLVKTTTSTGVEIPQATITIRVPAASLTDAMNQIKGMVANKNSDISSENITGQDVTKEYTDLNSHLTNLQNERDQLQKFLADAKKPEDVLNIFNQISSVTDQIEVLQGQIKYYQESATMSAISVQIISKTSVQPISVAGWQPVGVARDAVQALLNALQWIANALIWIGIFCLPIALLAAIPIYLIFLGFRRYRARRKPQTPVESSPTE